MPAHISQSAVDAVADKVFKDPSNFIPGGTINRNVNFELRRPERYPFSASLLEEALSPQRSCADANIPHWWCHCGSAAQAVGLTDANMLRAAAKAVQFINDKTSDDSVCAPVRLARVEHAEKSVVEMQQADYSGIAKDGAAGRYTETSYLINFATQPAALWQARGTPDLIASVIRISTYGTDPCDKKDQNPQFCMCHGA